MKKRNKAVFVPDGQKEPEGEYGTLWSEYHIPLLKVLIDFGGGGKACEVIEEVEKEMKLKEVDYQKTDSGAIRWKVNVRYARNYLMDKGFLDKNAPYGIWKITEKGRKYYQTESKNLPKH